MSATQGLVEDVLAGRPRAIARAISLVEDEAPDAPALITQLFRHTGRASVLGVTGPPGAGKSTLVDRLAVEMRREGLTVGVLAVDPSSPFTGGAVLGDRVRMGAHHADPDVFIRSMATRGHLGGLSRTTGDAALVLDAAGKDMVIVETVGVGQDEVDVAWAADVTVVVLVPGAGDDVQAIKAGVMEIADVFVVNKADRDGADRAMAVLAANQSLQTFDDGAWRPPILRTEATNGRGVAELWAEIRRCLTDTAGARQARRRTRHGWRFRELLAERCLREVEASLPAGEIDRVVDRIAERLIDPYSAVDDIMRRAAI